MPTRIAETKKKKIKIFDNDIKNLYYCKEIV